MSNHECNNYASFEDWFLDTMDYSSAQTLRDWGAGAGVCGLTNDCDIRALFDRFGSEIQEIVKNAYQQEVWEIAELYKVFNVNELITHLVHAAAMELAHTHAHAFFSEEELEDQSSEEQQ